MIDMALHSVRAHFLPYYMSRRDDGKYVIYNRNYNPIGLVSNGHINPDDHPVAVRLKGLTPGLAKKLSHNGSSNTKDIELYCDGCHPSSSVKNRHAYNRRMALLMKLMTVPDDEDEPLLPKKSKVA